MRVTHIITRLIVGGAQENTVSSVLGLREKPGLEVELVSGPTVASPEGSLEECFNHVSGVLTVAPDLIRAVHPARDFRALRHLTRMLCERKPDIVHTHSSKAGILGRIAAHRAGVPCIVHTIHGPSFGRFQGAVPNVLYRAAERYAGRFTSHFVSVANAMSRQYMEAGIGRPEQFTRIFSGFPLEPFLEARNCLEHRKDLGLEPRDFVVGKIARLFELKGHDDLFDAAPELVHRCPRMKFLLVGGGPWQERFERRASELGLARHFVFTGLVKPCEVPPLVGLMDCLVHLSYREGLPRALPQAMAAGKPVVAYDCDGAGEVCLDDETGFLIQPGDRFGLMGALSKLAEQPALRERMGARGRELVREWFPVERMVEDLYSLYQKLVQSRPGTG